MPRKRSLDVTISDYRNSNRPEFKWIVRWPAEVPGEPRRYQRFKTHKQAKAFKERKEIDLEKKGVEGASIHQNAIEEAKWAIQALEPYGVGIRHAVQSFIDRQEQIASTVTVEAGSKLFLEAKEQDGASDRYQCDLRLRMKRFGANFGHRNICDIHTKELDRWLRELGHGPVTRNNYRRTLKVFFSWAESLGYCESNPARKTTVAKKKPEPIAVFTPGELRRILNKAPDHLLPSIALGAFAGLRVSEIAQLDWQEVNFLKGYIEVAAEKSKTASRRFVPMEVALRAWITPFAKPRGAVAPSGLDSKLSVYRRKLDSKVDSKGNERPKEEIIEWKPNGLRHSFASYAIAREQDAAKVALWLGHTSPKMTFEAYQERVTEEEAKKWFDVLPSLGSESVTKTGTG